MAGKDIWQEFDCPHGADTDLFEEDIAVVGEQVYCSWCGGYHTAGIDGPTHTGIRLSDGEVHYRGLPADAAEKAAWIAEAVPYPGFE